METGRSQEACKVSADVPSSKGRLRGLVSWLAAVGALLWAVSASAQPLEAPALKAIDSMELRAALQQGEYEQLRKLARDYDSSGALLARAHLAELRGKLDSAASYSRAALEQASSRKTTRASQLAVARLQRATGDWKGAEERLRSYLADDSKAHAIRLELGELLIDQGRRGEAEPLLETLSRDFNAGRLEGRVELASLGRAMELLGSHRDANHAFSLGFEEREERPYPPGRVRWGELFLSKYNTADAEETFDEVLEVHSDHPGALVGKARVILETQNYYTEARRYLDRAEAVYPASPEVALTRAELAIHDGNWDEALSLAAKVLESRPKHLEAMAVKAGVHYLQEDRDAYERVKERVLSLNPDYDRVLTRTAEFAVRAHRYEESVELYEKALEVNSRSASARVGYGIALSRVGRIDEAIRELERATQADPYHVRAHNMLVFFDEVFPKYETRRHDGFLMRAHRENAPVLDEIVAPVVDRAIDVYTEKYGYEVDEELSVEIYRKPSSFGARTVGLPQINPHGLTFGKVVATRSPREGNFNWRQVVWHEMAHVFHIQESGYRVPRWFTEGLAEYETNVEEPAWIRQREPSIAAALRNDELPSIVELDREFSQARSYTDILRAYHLSSLVIHFVVGEWDFEAVGEMVEGFGEYVRTPVVLREVLGVSVEEFDRRLRDWLASRLSHFQNQMLIDLRSIPRREKLEEAIGGEPETAWELAQMAIAVLREGKAGKAEEYIERAVERDGGEARVRFVAMTIAAKRGRMKTAYDHGIAAIESGADGYGIRLRLGRVARALERLEAARVHLQAATQLYPDGGGAWTELLKVAKSTEDEELERLAVQRLFALDHTSARSARRFVEFWRDRERPDRAWRGVERWFDVAPLDPSMHRTRIDVALERDDTDAAVESWKLLGEIRSNRRVDIYRKGIERLRDEGYDDAAEDLVEAARERGASADALNR